MILASPTAYTMKALTMANDALIAPPGTVWVCPMCGKRASHKYDGGISRMWDESCAMHAILCKTDDTLKFGADGRVCAAEPADGEKNDAPKL